ncbi:MAG TPA: DUF3299 domain-containing protein [Ohtaekwangia sp.]|uniref:DUF3299 domain-containing protein n=1 Tax=Ohtaekwangia sp. TaxID=2066019 RepID=UPI002F9435DD
MKVLKTVSTISKSIFLVFLISLMALSAYSQKKAAYKGFPSLVWPKLYNITFVKAQDRLGEVDKPVFTDAVRALNGKQVTLPGYMVPFENGMKGNHFMLSSLPLNACFFCGVGGPETVVEVFSTKAVSYTEKPIEIQGKLMLNDKNPDQMIYILENAEVIGEAGL